MDAAALRQNIDQVRGRVERACRRAGRDSSSVTIIAVTKTVPAELVRLAIELGLSDLGENRVQEAREKQRVLESRVLSLRWHLIGHLQRNKAKPAAQLFDVIHSVDSVGLAQELERQAAAQSRQLEILVQVNVSGEAMKFGCAPSDAEAVVRAVQAGPHLAFGGLMTIAPYADSPDAARPVFRGLRQLRDDLLHSSLVTGHSSLKLSMGMSGDFEAAIEEGADFVRIGTAIFGTRDMGRGT